MHIECGTLIADRYRVEGRLGAGGMGSVWRARDLRLGRPVAVKLANASSAPDGGSGQVRRRLHREAAALAALSERHIARVYDLLEADRELCLVMELVDGESLATLLNDRKRLSVGEALRITAQCAHALESAHRRGIVHRDMKPSNIMIGADGVKVVDFGIAALTGAAHEDITRTMPHTLAGTAAYFAPERAFGGLAEPASDFYSLGVVLYRMLAGRLPYRADGTLPMVYAHVTAAPAPLPSDVPPPVVDLCLRMLDKRPEARPTTAAQVIAVQEALRPGSTAKGRHARTHGRLAALSSTAAALISATAWLSVGPPGNAGASAPPRKPAPTAPTSASPIVLGPQSTSTGTSPAAAPPPAPVSRTTVQTASLQQGPNPGKHLGEGPPGDPQLKGKGPDKGKHGD